jgi:hypothetical protein
MRNAECGMRSCGRRNWELIQFVFIPHSAFRTPHSKRVIDSLTARFFAHWPGCRARDKVFIIGIAVAVSEGDDVPFSSTFELPSESR